MDKYEQLRTIRNESLHEGIVRLDYGCEFQYHKEWGDEMLTVCAIYDDTGNTRTLSYLPPNKEIQYEIEDFSREKIKVLGKEVTLQEVLLMISTTAICDGSVSSIENGDMEIKHYPEYKNKDEELIQINLSKPIKDQDEEVLGKLINLLTY